MSIAAALIAAAGGIVGLADVGGIYGRETAAFIDEAIAQDIVNLAVVSPAIVVLALLARRGSLTAYLAWLGAMAFTVYNYVIYTMSIQAGPLFLAWVAVLGLSVYALIGGLAALDPRSVGARFIAAPRRTVGWFLIVVATVFGGLWLTDIVPALLSGQAPAAARDLGLPSSPVHVLDLAFYLPAHRRHRNQVTVTGRRLDSSLRSPVAFVHQRRRPCCRRVTHQGAPSHAN